MDFEKKRIALATYVVAIRLIGGESIPPRKRPWIALPVQPTDKGLPEAKW